MVYQFCKRTIEYISVYSGQDINQDQQDIYIYGMECFINTAVPVIFLTIFPLHLTVCLKHGYGFLLSLHFASTLAVIMHPHNLLALHSAHV